ncbi:substrate-binding domain-containing protein [Thermoflexus hugenholtzii]|uniref:Phosphonate transport system substrate-binding protein n=1 Tax=Thermoflexus hugenholtzii JAD2 TaxID=877466 RepID=A0A212R9C5_9CHLR|nr:phosphate/phosphite/phosphonate ABC transporter substrate-binding protein [Thermoflexus hugenholtzii]SNB68607.1 phosphonate transport system substrate-binding protein [Thermoflexus hugenholtzii JAD2]
MGVKRLCRALRWGLVALTLWLGACGGTAEPMPYVDFNRRVPLATPRHTGVVPLRVGIAAVLSPQSSAEAYQELLQYLSHRLNRPVERVQRRDYRDMNTAIARGEVDIAFICTWAYVIGQREHGFSLLAVPVVNGKPTYQSWVIVRADLPIHRMEDLRGRVFAFVDPLSNTGYLYPRYLVHRLGETPARFFRRTFFTYGHDRAIRAVAQGLADGAAVDSLVLQFLLEQEPELAGKVRVIDRSSEFGAPPVVAAPRLAPQVRAEIQALLLSAHEDPEGRRALRAIGVERFVKGDDAWYDGVRRLEAAIAGEEP